MEYWGGDIRWLSSGETREKFIIDTEKRITKIGVENSSTRIASPFSTVIASAGQGNTRGQTSLLLVESYVNQSVVVLTADPERSSALYLFFDLERRYDEFRRVSDAHSSRGSLTTKLIAELDAIIPPVALARQFELSVAPMMERIFSNLRESQVLYSLHHTLLPKLTSGELRMRDAEKITEAACA
jgi:type I restriction enzyme S subunit